MAEEPLVVKVEVEDVVTVPFHGTVLANVNKTLVSKRISYPFRLRGARAHFALGTDRTLRLKVYISPDESAPTAEPLTGDNVLDPAGQVDYVVGDDEPVDIPYNVSVNAEGMYIKVYAENLDSWPHTVTCYVFIQKLERKAGK